MESSMLDKVTPFGWDDATMTRFEVTLEVIGQVMAEYTTRITTAESTDATDSESVQQWRQHRSRAAVDRRHLRSSDPALVQQTLERYSQELQQLRTGA